jgi:CarD family transcriptional regulator
MSTDNFAVGDKAIYPARGLAEVTAIEDKEVGGYTQRFYVLRVAETEQTIMVPVTRVTDVGLRQVIASDKISDVYDILKERDVEIDTQTWNRRYRGYIEKIKTGSVFEVAEVLRDLYLLRNDKTLSFGERRMLDMAKRLLVQELSVAKNMGEDAVEEELEDIFKPIGQPDGA